MQFLVSDDWTLSRKFKARGKPCPVFPPGAEVQEWCCVPDTGLGTAGCSVQRKRHTPVLPEVFSVKSELVLNLLPEAQDLRVRTLSPNKGTF